MMQSEEINQWAYQCAPGTLLPIAISFVLLLAALALLALRRCLLLRRGLLLDLFEKQQNLPTILLSYMFNI